MIGGLTWPDARRGQADHLYEMSWRVLGEGSVKTAPQFEHSGAHTDAIFSLLLGQISLLVA